MADAATMTIEEFKAHLLSCGYEPEDRSLVEMYAALPHLDALRARLRRVYVYSDEPAHIFSVSKAV